MRYLDIASGSPLLPKVAGTYEVEIADWIEAAVHAAPDLVVDVGAAEGYYAVGMARRLPGARVVASDRRRSARALCRRLASRNGVTVELCGAITGAQLDALLGTARAPMLICDIDGGELDLIQPAEMPALARTRVIIETHEMFVPGVNHVLEKRLAQTHTVHRRDSRPRAVELLPQVAPDEATAIMDERRPAPQSWLLAVPGAAGRGAAAPSGAAAPDR
jgi:hypothetical protein